MAIRVIILPKGYMERQYVTRPQAENRKISTKNDYELCYLRHQYFRRVEFNPSDAEMAPYLGIIKNLTKNTYYMYRNLFLVNGLDLDDLGNIGRVHLVSFLGLFSLEQLPQKYTEFVAVLAKKGIEIDDQQISQKNKANFTIFFKQRMEDLVRICRQKGRNIKGLPTEEYYAYYGPIIPQVQSYMILENHERYGLRRLDMPTYKTIKKKVGAKGPNPFKFAGYWYLSVPLEKRQLSIVDFTGAGLDPYDNIHNKTPEELMIESETENNFLKKLKAFKLKTNKEKRSIVKKFISKNKANPKLAPEIVLAKKYLENLRD